MVIVTNILEIVHLKYSLIILHHIFLWFYIFTVLKHYHCLSRCELNFELDFHCAPHMSLSLRCEEPCMRSNRCPARCPCQNGGICQGRGVCLCPPGWMVRNLCIGCGFFVCLFFVEHPFLATLSLCFRVQCVLSGVHRVVLVQTVLKNVCVITEATVIQKKANASVMQAILEKGLHTFNVCVLLYFLYYVQNRLDTCFWVTPVKKLFAKCQLIACR